MSDEKRSTTGAAEMKAAQALTTKVLAIGSWTSKATPETRPPVMPFEARDTLRLQLAGKIDQWFAKTDGSGAVFLMNVTTSVTGFMFHSKFGPASVIGAVSLVVLAVALTALYGFKLRGSSRWMYVVSVSIALYLNVFVAVVQTFQKATLFHSLAPTQAEPPFAIAQGLVLLVFVALGIIATKRFHPSPESMAPLSAI